MRTPITRMTATELIAKEAALMDLSTRPTAGTANVAGLARTGVVTALLLVAGLLSACTSGSTSTSPTTTSPTSTAAPASPTKATQAPGSPSKTSRPTKAGPTTPDLATLKSAAKAYFAAHNAAVRTRNTTAFRRTFSSRCTLCTAEALGLDKYTRLGQTLHGGDYHMSGGTLVKTAPPEGMLFFSVTQDPSFLTDRKGNRIKTFQGGQAPRTYLTFSAKPGAWIVTGAIVESP
jgi:hypothetical protein